jgi:hypothetical protein
MIKSNRMRWAVHMVHMLQKNCMELLVAKYDVRRLPGRPRYRWEVGWKVVNCFLSFSGYMPLAY